MSKWIQNLAAVLDDKPIVLLHGNVRDRYIDDDGKVFDSLTVLLEHLARKVPQRFSRMVFYDLASRERTVHLMDRVAPQGNAAPPAEFEDTAPNAGPRQQEPPARYLARIASELSEPHQRVISVIHYLDKLIPYRTSYSDEECERLLWLEKAIENIALENRLVLVALSDSMVPIEVYTHSPNCRLLAIPLPDKTDREAYIRRQLGRHEHLELMADLTDGLYLTELTHIAENVKESNLADANEIRRIVNRYRIGEQEDYWGSLSITKLDSAFDWFTTTGGIKGQDQAVQKVAEVLALARAGLSGIASGTTAKPKGAVFFAGPTGVGKTFVAKKLARFLFNTEEAFTRFDMSEFKEEHTVSKLIGSPPGYIGYERGGMLTNAVRERPFSVVLFDEIEKANPKIMDIFLQLLDEGRLTDSRGQTVFFTETVIIFTSNIGCRTLDGRGNVLEEQENLRKLLDRSELSDAERQQSVREHFLASVEKFFLFEISRPELLNRIGSNIVPFNYIDSVETQREIVSSHLTRIAEEFKEKYRANSFQLTIDPAVPAFMTSRYGDKMTQFGGRGITNALEVEIVRVLAREVLRAEYAGKAGVDFRVRVSGAKNEIQIEAHSRD